MGAGPFPRNGDKRMVKGKTKTPEPEVEESTIEANAGVREEQRAAELDNMKLIYAGTEIDLSSAVQGIRDATLEVFKHRRDPWHKLSTQEQKDMATAIELGAKISVRKTAELMAAQGRPHVRAMLKRYQDDGGKIGVTLEIAMADTPTVVQLHQASGKEVIIITADASEFANGKPPATQPDEPALDFEAGSDFVDPPANDSDLADDDEDSPIAPPAGERVDLASGMYQTRPEGADDEGWVDEREATPEELAAERERQADFDDATADE